ncbi:hypothetical protein K456DRAFT_899062 [Colletotrichum gloeosporioides 23]|nr:hypothetical protein K456DRAFT_899062 [Colletotrichum gloeosporioides 23]
MGHWSSGPLAIGASGFDQSRRPSLDCPSRTSAHLKPWAPQRLDRTAGHHRLDLGNIPIDLTSLIRRLCFGRDSSYLVKRRKLSSSISISSGVSLPSCKPCSQEVIEDTHDLVSHHHRWTSWMCFELNRIAHKLSPCCSSFEEPLVFSAAEGIEGFEPEYSQRGPKRKQILLWQCCQCGQGGNPIRHDNCYNCHYPRCAYCPVRKVRA